MQLIKHTTNGFTKYTTEDTPHNPHRPAMSTVCGSFIYYINGKEHNIIGCSSHIANDIDYYINGIMI